MLQNEIFNEDVLKNHDLVMVEIGADWSGTSHIIAPVIEKIVTKYHQQLKYFKLDIDLNKKVAEKYFITEIPSFLFFKNGRYVDCLKGCISEKEFQIRIQTLL